MGRIVLVAVRPGLERVGLERVGWTHVGTCEIQGSFYCASLRSR